MQKFYKKSTAEVYAEYVRVCEMRGVRPMSKVGFCRAFLAENPDYRVAVCKPDGKLSVKFFVKDGGNLRENVSSFLWDAEL